MTAHDAPLALCLSKQANSFLDLAIRIALKELSANHVVGQFHKYPDCGDEICFDTVGYDIPTSTLSRVGEAFRLYHSSQDDLPTFLQPDWQARHQELTAVLVGALSSVEENIGLRATFRGNPCLSNPALDLYLCPGNVNNQRVAEGDLRDLEGGTIDARNFMEFFLGCLSRADTTVLEIAYSANLPVAYVRDYAHRFAAKGLATLCPVDRRLATSSLVPTSLLRAGLI